MLSLGNSVTRSVRIITAILLFLLVGLASLCSYADAEVIPHILILPTRGSEATDSIARQVLENRYLVTRVIQGLSKLDHDGIPADSAKLFDLFEMLYSVRPFDDWKNTSSNLLSWSIRSCDVDNRPPSDYELYLRWAGSWGPYERLFFVRDSSMVVVQSLNGYYRPTLNLIGLAQSHGNDQCQRFVSESLFVSLLPGDGIGQSGTADVAMMDAIFAGETSAEMTPLPRFFCWHSRRGQSLGFQDCSCEHRRTFYEAQLRALSLRLRDA